LGDNLSDIHSNSKAKFVRWGDSSARHFGELSDAMFENGRNSTIRKLKWKNNLFYKDQDEYFLKTPIYFAAKAWKHNDLAWDGKHCGVRELVEKKIKKQFKPLLMGHQSPDKLIIEYQKILNLKLYFSIEKLPEARWQLELGFSYMINDSKVVDFKELFEVKPETELLINDILVESSKLLKEYRGLQTNRAFFGNFHKQFYSKKKMHTTKIEIDRLILRDFLLFALPNVFYPKDIYCRVDIRELKEIMFDEPETKISIGVEQPQFNLEFDNLLLDQIEKIDGDQSIGEKISLPIKKTSRNFKTIPISLLNMFQNSLTDNPNGIIAKPNSITQDNFPILSSLAKYSPPDINSSSFFAKSITYPNIPAPSNFVGRLFNFQEIGLGFLKTLCDENQGALLCDDMGLGKTIQTLAYLSDRAKSNKSNNILIVCPASVVPQWHHKIQEFCPNLLSTIYHGTSRYIPKSKSIIVTTYHTLVNDFKILSQHHFDGIIIDEAHKIKNIYTQTALRILELKADFRIALTGTPIENKLLDLYPIVEFLNPGYLGSYKYFTDNYYKPLVHMTSSQREQDVNYLELKAKIHQISLRRTKRKLKSEYDHLTLPILSEELIPCSLSHEQFQVQSALIRNHEATEKASKLGLITKLKLVCNHPELVYPSGKALHARSGKLDRLIDLIEKIREGNEKVVIFSQFTKMLDIIRSEINSHFDVETADITGKTPLKKRYKIIETFSKQKQFSILLISLLAGGEGINLSNTKNLILFDSWWNYSKELQAQDRINRIDQVHKEIFIYKFYCENSIEGAIMNLVQKKKTLSASMLNDESRMIEIADEFIFNKKPSFLQL